MRILFIDDDDVRTKAIREGLEVLGGYEVVFIRVPNIGVETFKKDPNSFSVVVVDIMLPHYEIPEYRDFKLENFKFHGDGFKCFLHGHRQGKQIPQPLGHSSRQLERPTPAKPQRPAAKFVGVPLVV